METKTDPRISSSPTVSVIIPIGDPRAELDYVRSWTQAQNAADELFEVIVVTDGKNPELDSRYRSILRPDDQLINTPGNRFSHYTDGATVARAPWLLLTEDHCVGDSDCLSKVIEYIQDHSGDCAALQYEQINQSRLARMEGLLIQDTLSQIELQHGKWNKVHARGFVIHRQAFFKYGGIPREFEFFSEALLSMRLHVGGVNVGYIPGAIVKHVNNVDFDNMLYDISRYVSGECKFRQQLASEYSEEYLGLPQEWADRHQYSRPVARQGARAVWKTIRAQSGNRNLLDYAQLFPELIDRTIASVFGDSLRLRTSQLKLQYIKVRAWFWFFSEPRQLMAVKAFWQEAARLGRLKYISEHCATNNGAKPAQGCKHIVDDMPSSAMTGVSALEFWHGMPFRWTSPVASFEFEIPEGKYNAEIDTASIRGGNCEYVFSLFWNDCKISEESIQIETGRITFPICPRKFNPNAHQRLSIVTSPIPPRGNEKRRLGMPVHCIRFVPLTDSEVDNRSPGNKAPIQPTYVR